MLNLKVSQTIYSAFRGNILPTSFTYLINTYKKLFFLFHPEYLYKSIYFHEKRAVSVSPLIAVTTIPAAKSHPFWFLPKTTMCAWRCFRRLFDLFPMLSRASYVAAYHLIFEEIHRPLWRCTSIFLPHANMWTHIPNKLRLAHLLIINMN